MPDLSDSKAAAAWLRTTEAIRARCGAVFAAAEAGTLAHFVFDLACMDAVADYVVETIRETYPTLDIPYHSRWRHVGVGGRDRWAALAERLDGAAPDEVARVRFDLAVTSVLLDAGAGARWRYREPGTNETYARSEGLAVASVHMFAGGAFSARDGAPLRADAAALDGVTAARLAAAFQAGPDNPLVGLEGRAALLARLAAALRARPDMFGAGELRIGNLADYLTGRAEDGRLAAVEILGAVLEGLGPIWPGRIEIAGQNLGDVWRHPAAGGTGPSAGLVPFHKLSQWLAYSLVEPLEDTGLTVTGLEELTGLPEYRNGGLFVDLGVVRPKHEGVTTAAHPVDSEVVVEWRALTVVLLDRLADLVRQRLGLDAAALPLAKVLEGGTWAAGRRIARERRPDGGPPITVASDGTVF